MNGKHHRPLMALALCALFVFMLIPGDLLHDHGDHHGMVACEGDLADHDLLELDCALCDLVMPARLEVAAVDGWLLECVILIASLDLGSPLLQGSWLFHTDRGPPSFV